ncbi:translation initiation factor IF-1 [Sphingopyxis flava]|uniref:Translation initiation factor IF-1 n=1 Tax=Sphingopyxis flava TaxID=1507287 RepID=A0A1T5GM65_9SPHN|nr:translation initiation factor IF-1 [Sphingopyxis flava]SKC09430.1 translation initiation factor IF-1 [Sphingopyxis flava]
MAKEEVLTFEGMIDEILPGGRFRVELENGHRLIAYTAGRMRRFRIRSVVGDAVRVEMTPYDLLWTPRRTHLWTPRRTQAIIWV